MKTTKITIEPSDRYILVVSDLQKDIILQSKINKNGNALD